MTDKTEKARKLLEQLLSDYQAWVWLIWESHMVKNRQVLELTVILTSEEKLNRYKKSEESYNAKRHPDRQLFTEKVPLNHWFGSSYFLREAI